jgi:hypothetical protein
MVALLRPDSWDFPLFLHVLGAVALFGGVGAVALLVFASLRREPPTAVLLRRLAFTTMLVVVWPAYVVMRIGAQWILSKEYPGELPDWAAVGLGISDGGIVLLALLTLCTWLGVRQTRAEQPRPRSVTIAATLAALYLVALGVAVFTMTTKPGA